VAWNGIKRSIMHILSLPTTPNYLIEFILFWTK